MIDVPEGMILCNKITKILQSYARRLICQRKEVKKTREANQTSTITKKMQEIKNNKDKLKPRRLQNIFNKFDKEKN